MIFVEVFQLNETETIWLEGGASKARTALSLCLSWAALWAWTDQGSVWGPWVPFPVQTLSLLILGFQTPLGEG